MGEHERLVPATADGTAGDTDGSLGGKETVATDVAVVPMVPPPDVLAPGGRGQCDLWCHSSLRKEWRPRGWPGPGVVDHLLRAGYGLGGRINGFSSAGTASIPPPRTTRAAIMFLAIRPPPWWWRRPL